jgi:hypothetical protein
MTRIRYVITFCGLIAIPIWSLYQIIFMVGQDGINGTLLNATINLTELLLLLHVLVLATSLVIFQLLIVGRSRPALRKYLRLFHKPITWIGASLVFAPSSDHLPVVVAHQSEGVPAIGILSPAVAAGALAHILRRRREQIQKMVSPDRLTESELQIMEQIQRCAQKHKVNSPEMIDLIAI